MGDSRRYKATGRSGSYSAQCATPTSPEGLRIRRRADLLASVQRHGSFDAETHFWGDGWRQRNAPPCTSVFVLPGGKAGMAPKFVCME